MQNTQFEIIINAQQVQLLQAALAHYNASADSCKHTAEEKEELELLQDMLKVEELHTDGINGLCF